MPLLDGQLISDPSPLVCTCFAVRRAARHVSQVYDGHLASTGLRTTQYSLLNVLAGDGPRSLAAVAKRMGLDRTTLGRNLRPLEREGLVSMTVDPTDRRGRTLVITEIGLTKLAEARTCWATAQAAFEARYGATETSQLHATLDAVARLDFGAQR